MGNRAPSYKEDQDWRRGEHDLFRHVGQRLRDAIPPDDWLQFDVDERRRRVEEAAAIVRRELGVKRPAPLVRDDDPTDAGVWYDEKSVDGDIHFPKHHLAEAKPDELVRGLSEEIRHAWQDDVRRGLTDHPLGEVGRRSIEHGFAIYNLEDARNDTTNLLELDAKERAEWCVGGYSGNPPNFD